MILSFLQNRKHTGADAACSGSGTSHLVGIDVGGGGCVGVSQLRCGSDEIHTVGNHGGGCGVTEGMGMDSAFGKYTSIFLYPLRTVSASFAGGLMGVTPITSAVVMTNAMLAKTMPESEFAQANSVLAETIP